MELKQGYKQTEVGVIPEDWDVQPLEKLSSKIMVGIASAATHAYRSSGVPMFRNQNIKEGWLDDSDLRFLDAGFDELFRGKRLLDGDLLTARTGYPGTTAVVPREYSGAQSFTSLITRPDNGIIDSNYLCLYINSPAGKAFFEQSQIGGAQKNVNANSLKRMPVAFPNAKEEQELIADAVATVDAFISSLENLIAKKRDIKQAAMQELLTGKRRLPGFEGEWEVKRLGEALTICHGKHQHDVEVLDGPYPILATGGQIGTADRPLYTKPSVLIGRKGTINKPQYMETPFWTVDTLFYSEMRNGSIAKFFYYLFCSIDWMQFNEASGVPSLNARTIERVELSLPVINEQAAIAAVLSDMDTELAALEARLKKARELKQGMMQELLTGRTRLT